MAVTSRHFTLIWYCQKDLTLTLIKNDASGLTRLAGGLSDTDIAQDRLSALTGQ